jgi:hypothetical protein
MGNNSVNKGHCEPITATVMLAKMEKQGKSSSENSSCVGVR